MRCIALEIKRDTELGIAFEGGPRRGKNERLERKGKKKRKKITCALWRIRKAAGLTGDQAESKRASSGRLDSL